MKKLLLFSLSFFIIGSIPIIVLAQQGISDFHYIDKIEKSSLGNRNFAISDVTVPQDQKIKYFNVQQTVTGRITDSTTGESLPGVNIIVQGTTIGTTTDSDGVYELDVPSLEGTLVFSYIGYLTQTVAIGNN